MSIYIIYICVIETFELYLNYNTEYFHIMTFLVLPYVAMTLHSVLIIITN